MSEDDYKIIFSKNLRRYLEKNNKTQNDLIKDLGLSSSTVSNWCTGTKMPRMNSVEMLANYFGISKSDLIENKDENKDEDIKRIERARKKMNPEQKEHMMKILRSVFDDFFED